MLAHSDIAPAREKDPGERFPWRLFAESGVGLWVNPAPITKTGHIYVLGESHPTIEEVQRLLGRYAYNVVPTGYLDSNTRDAVAAFQRHFRTMRIDRVVNVSTVATLKALITERDGQLASLRQNDAPATA